MKKILITLTLVAAVAGAYGQGAVQFSNGTLTRLSTSKQDGTAIAQIPLTQGLINFGMFYGVGQSTSLTFWSAQLGVNSTPSLGIIANPSDNKSAMNTISLGSDTSPGETDVWMQIKAWSASFGSDWAGAQAAFSTQNGVYFGQSVVRNINALGNPTGSGVAIWQGATATNTRLINAFVIPQSSVVVPEPASFALCGLGAAAMLIFRRRK